MLRKLSIITGDDIRTAVFLQGNVDVVSHDDYWADKLDVDFDYFVETRCLNTATLFEYIFDLFGGQESEHDFPSKKIEEDLQSQGNIFVYSLRPEDGDSENHSTHTGIIIRDDDGTYITVDSYANLYSLRIKSFSNRSFKDNVVDIINLFLFSPSEHLWYEITGSRDFNKKDSYVLTLEAYERSLDVDIESRVRSLYIDSLQKLEGPTKGNTHRKETEEYEDYEDSRNIYRDDIMTLVLGGYKDNSMETTVNFLREKLNV